MSDKKLLVVGSSSIVSTELSKLYSHQDNVLLLGRETQPVFNITAETEQNLSVIDLTYDHYCINLGVLFGKNALDIDIDDAIFAMLVNVVYPVRVCEYILKNNNKARIVLIGSESGEKGSYDTFYFLAKTALNSYVRERRISSAGQTINIINPSIFEDGRMTTSRLDQDRVKSALLNNPKQRPLYGKDVAKLTYDVLNESSGFLTNQIIGFNGGKFARM